MDVEGVGCGGDLVGVCWESGVDAEGDDFALGGAGRGDFQAQAGAVFELLGEDGGGGRFRADDDGFREIDGVEGGGQQEGEQWVTHGFVGSLSGGLLYSR